MLFRSRITCKNARFAQCTLGLLLSYGRKTVKLSASMKIALKGKPKSEEHKRKISEAIKRKNQQKKNAELV